MLVAVFKNIFFVLFIGNESAPIQLTQCRFPGLAGQPFSNAKILIYIPGTYTETILSNSARKLLRFDNNNMLIAV